MSDWKDEHGWDDKQPRETLRCNSCNEVLPDPEQHVLKRCCKCGGDLCDACALKTSGDHTEDGDLCPDCLKDSVSIIRRKIRSAVIFALYALDISLSEEKDVDGDIVLNFQNWCELKIFGE